MATNPEPDAWALQKPIQLIPKALVLWKRRQRGSESYYCRILVPRKYRALNLGRRYIVESCGTGDETVARMEALGKFYAAKGKWESSIPLAELSIGSCLEAYLADLKAKHPPIGKRESLYRGKAKALAPVIEIIGRKSLANLNDEDLAFYKSVRLRQRKKRIVKSRIRNNTLGHLPPKTISERTAELEISVFKTALKWARAKRLWFGELAYRAKKKNFRTRQALTEEQWNTLTTYLRSNKWLRVGKHKNDSRLIRHRHLVRAYILFMGNSGLRVGEARHLRFRDLTERVSKDGKPYLEVHVSAITSKVRKERWAIARETAAKAISRWKEWRTANDDFATEDDFVFANEDGEPIGDLREGFHAALKGAGVEYDSEGSPHTPYSLRHTYITLRLRHANNISIHELAQSCGTSVQMIEKVYGHVSSKDFVRGLIS